MYLCIYVTTQQNVDRFLTEMGELGKISPNCVSGKKFFFISKIYF